MDKPPFKPERELDAALGRVDFWYERMLSTNDEDSQDYFGERMTHWSLRVLELTGDDLEPDSQ